MLNNGDTGYALALGEAINSYYHYKLDGVWQKGEETDAAVFGAAPGDLKINIPNLVKESDGRFYKIDEETGSAPASSRPYMVMLFITLLIINILQVMQIIKFWVTTLRIGL